MHESIIASLDVLMEKLAGDLEAVLRVKDVLLRRNEEMEALPDGKTPPTRRRQPAPPDSGKSEVESVTGKKGTAHRDSQSSNESDRRICSRCGEQKPINEFRPAPGGYHTKTCKACIKKKFMETSAQAKVPLIARKVEGSSATGPAVPVKTSTQITRKQASTIDKTCASCYLKKNLIEFRRETDMPDGWSEDCRACLRKQGEAVG